MMTLEIAVHDSLDAAAADWATPGLAGYAFQDFEWTNAWQTTLGAAQGMRPAIVVVRDTGVPVLLVPLGIHRRRGLRTLAFLGGQVTDYHAPLIDPAFAAMLDPAAFAALWTRVLAALPTHDLIRFERMPAVIDAGGQDVANPLASLGYARDAGQAWSVAVPEGYDALQKRLRTKFVADTKRQQRRLAEQAPLTLQVATTPAEAARVLDAVAGMKSRRWLETGGPDWFAVPAFRAFYQALLPQCAPEGHVHASALMVGDTPVAAHLGLSAGARFYYIMVGWEAGEWQRFSTGRLIVDRLLHLVAAQGVRVFDFTVGEEPYKQDWVDTPLKLRALTQARTARGRAALAAEAAWASLRRQAREVAWLRDAVRRARGLPPKAK